MAAERRELDMTSCFLEVETDVNLRDNKGVTALMWASYQGYFEILKFLLNAKNINLDIKN